MKFIKIERLIKEADDVKEVILSFFYMKFIHVNVFLKEANNVHYVR